MNLAYEFSKIKDAFSKVRKDMTFLSEKIVDNYDDFMRRHQQLGLEVEYLSNSVKKHLDELRNRAFDNHSEKKFQDIKLELKELKKEVEKISSKHSTLKETLDNLKKTPKDNLENLKEVKQRLHSNELELYLLKERMVEKDLEIKQLKEISSKLFEILDELTKAEHEMLKLRR